MEVGENFHQASVPQGIGDDVLGESHDAHSRESKAIYDLGVVDRVDRLVGVLLLGGRRQDAALRGGHSRDGGFVGVQRHGRERGVHECAEAGSKRALGRSRNGDQADVGHVRRIERTIDGGSAHSDPTQSSGPCRGPAAPRNSSMPAPPA